MSKQYQDMISKVAGAIIDETVEEEKLAMENDPVMAKLAGYYEQMEKAASADETTEDTEEDPVIKKCAAYYGQAQAMKEAAMQVLQEAELLEKAALEVFEEIKK